MPTRVGGDALHRARSARGLTHSQLAQIIDVSGGERVSECERGVRTPAVRLIPAVAAALGVTPLEFLALPNGVDLKALRLASGMTSTEIAEQTQVSSATYLRWESGRSRATRDPAVRRRLAKALGVRRPPLPGGGRGALSDGALAGPRCRLTEQGTGPSPVDENS